MALTNKYASAAGAGTHDGSSEANAFSFTEMGADISAGSKAGNVYNYKGNVSSSSVITISNGGTAVSPVVIRGYSATIGDGYLGRVGGGNLITTNMPTWTFTGSGRLSISGTFVVLESLQITAAVNNNTVTVTSGCLVQACKITNTIGSGASTGAFSQGTSLAGIAFNCDFEVTSGIGTQVVTSQSASNRVMCCRITGGGKGILSRGLVLGNTIYRCGSHGIYCDSASTQASYMFNTVVMNGGAGIQLTGTGIYLQGVAMNMITDNTGWGIECTTSGYSLALACNRFRDNGSGAISGAEDWEGGTGFARVDTDTGGPETDYVNYSTDDFRLISASPGAAAAFFQPASIGAYQLSAASGGGLLVHPGMTGGIRG